jgi:hypothetical protein
MDAGALLPGVVKRLDDTIDFLRVHSAVNLGKAQIKAYQQ